MSHEAKIHPIQTMILRDLLFKRDASFTDLRKIADIDSDHFKFHIRRLVELDYVVKSTRNRYLLTHSGKEYANKLDTDRNVIERQPKSAVIVVLENNSHEVLVQERLKHPYFGFWGYPGGKIRWGETIVAAAARELKEETGLGALLSYRGLYHEHVRSPEADELLEDKIFHIFYGRDPSGELKKTFEGGRNVWMNVQKLVEIKKKYVSTDIETDVGFGRVSFIEKTQTYTKDEF